MSTDQCRNMIRPVIAADREAQDVLAGRDYGDAPSAASGRAQHKKTPSQQLRAMYGGSTGRDARSAILGAAKDTLQRHFRPLRRFGHDTAWFNASTSEYTWLSRGEVPLLGTIE